MTEAGGVVTERRLGSWGEEGSRGWTLDVTSGDPSPGQWEAAPFRLTAMSGLLPFYPGSHPANHRLSVELPFNLLHNPFFPAQVEVRGKQGNGIHDRDFHFIFVLFSGGGGQRGH